ncbi:MAG TPA: hypothetical protein VGR64_03415, partial [Terracidiphilus sp.]|nr:hypothetical protein [Terracidiphilus sp.]
RVSGEEPRQQVFQKRVTPTFRLALPTTMLAVVILFEATFPVAGAFAERVVAVLADLDADFPRSDFFVALMSFPQDWDFNLRPTP